MLLGEYNHNIDDKGRVSVPAKFREDLGISFIVTKGLDNCLFAYSKEEWTKFEEKLKSLPLTNPNARNFIRFFFSGATECEIDKQGRINIPSSLSMYASLNKDCSIIGVDDHIEIWNTEIWNKYLSDNEPNIADIADKLFSKSL